MDDAAFEARREDELTDAGRRYCDAFAREHHDRLAAAGIRTDAGFHNMLFAAFRAGARFEAARQVTEIHRAMDEYAI